LSNTFGAISPGDFNRSSFSWACYSNVPLGMMHLMHFDIVKIALPETAAVTNHPGANRRWIKVISSDAGAISKRHRIRAVLCET
jgi:hypothetical protein